MTWQSHLVADLSFDRATAARYKSGKRDASHAQQSEGGADATRVALEAISNVTHGEQLHPREASSRVMLKIKRRSLPGGAYIYTH